MRYFDTRTLSRTMKSLYSESSDSMHESHGTHDVKGLPTYSTDNKGGVGSHMYEGGQPPLLEGLYA